MTKDSVEQTIHERLESFRQQSRIKAGSLIVSVFGDAVLPRGGRIWLGSLINLLGPLDLNERLVRTTVFRLVKDDWLTTQTQGRRTDYMLTASGQRRFEEAARQIYAAEAPLWDRRWRLVMVLGELAPREREQLRRALYWQGFGEFSPTCFVHPGADLESSFDALGADGMSGLLPKLMPLLAVNPRLGQSAHDADIVQSAWNLESLAGAYTDFVACYQPILDALRQSAPEGVDEQSAFLVRMLLIHDFRRLLLRDPELPEVLLPSGWPGHAARQLCKALYRRLLGPSERHLDRHLLLANGELPPASSLVSERFQGQDALTELA
ncbi:phenylacetic acid degradation operon negative regulatory protein PaaX [Malikia spinosa]|uniref:phenylacetic acid degradation operon negative regulatory protein PaaX n=1 Tax=Malikia spinosa TaxID=86180 RepID=UPI000A4A27BA|nr:phenylacetic acid degradation operon negative regulatory protein PaaX [Malikia spinosa]